MANGSSMALLLRKLPSLSEIVSQVSPSSQLAHERAIAEEAADELHRHNPYGMLQVQLLGLESGDGTANADVDAALRRAPLSCKVDVAGLVAESCYAMPAEGAAAADPLSPPAASWRWQQWFWFVAPRTQDPMTLQMRFRIILLDESELPARGAGGRRGSLATPGAVGAVGAVARSARCRRRRRRASRPPPPAASGRRRGRPGDGAGARLCARRVGRAGAARARRPRRRGGGRSLRRRAQARAARRRGPSTDPSPTYRPFQTSETLPARSVRLRRPPHARGRLPQRAPLRRLRRHHVARAVELAAARAPRATRRCPTRRRRSRARPTRSGASRCSTGRTCGSA